MTNIDRIHLIDRSKLSGKNYFASLIEQGRFYALLSDTEIERIQIESLTLLAKQTELFNHGASSSIPIEKAQDLLASILYTLGVQLKSYASPEDAIDRLKTENLDRLFYLGLKKINRKILIAKQTHLRLKRCLFKTKNVFYRLTAVDGINGFFKVYHPKFSAQEIHITADYPTFNGVDDLDGIEFIEKYLQNLTHENRFCSYFSEIAVHHLLCGLDEDYQKILLNVYEPVLIASLGCILTHHAGRDLNLNHKDIHTLANLFSGKDTDEVEQLIKNALDKLIAELGCSSDLSNYLRNSITKIAVSIKNAAHHNCLDKVFLIPFSPEDHQKILLSYGQRMDDKSYTAILHHLLQCNSADEKAEIICNRISSFGDLLEILQDADLMQEELLNIFRKIPSAVIAALIKRYPNEDFLYDESELKIYYALQTFKNLLPEEVRLQLEEAAKVIHFEIE
ncbi:DUF6179 domain-containing protein [Irregularibacter muris]|uniref:DUF6179 domain-containing protein n=1 Tax=Irregularibacter muris TaxID=1796619 RepID=A0AAE3HCW9_9FIRM|nr:DUF6179 domain-containing protein [Irregularibacter muris]MCR1897476.1 DUF6179 domain-containing protein [Irregularibacter muris]